MNSKETVLERPKVQSQAVVATATEPATPSALRNAAILGVAALLIGAAAWGALTAAANRQVGWMAIGVGFLVGKAVRLAANSRAPVFGILGAGLSLLGCVVGNLFAVGYVVYRTTGHIPIVKVLQQTADFFQPIDLLFYALAIFQGFKSALPPLEEDTDARRKLP